MTQFHRYLAEEVSEEAAPRRSPTRRRPPPPLNAAPDTRFVADLKAGVDELLRREPDREPGAVGFCFGGGMVWSLLAAGEPRLAAAAPFYGPLPASTTRSSTTPAPATTPPRPPPSTTA